jgi:hypothetical protein
MEKCPMQKKVCEKCGLTFTAAEEENHDCLAQLKR